MTPLRSTNLTRRANLRSVFPSVSRRLSQVFSVVRGILSSKPRRRVVSESSSRTTDHALALQSGAASSTQPNPKRLPSRKVYARHHGRGTARSPPSRRPTCTSISSHGARIIYAPNWVRDRACKHTAAADACTRSYVRTYVAA
jgi:hypothetical protein